MPVICRVHEGTTEVLNPEFRTLAPGGPSWGRLDGEDASEKGLNYACNTLAIVSAQSLCVPHHGWETRCPERCGWYCCGAPCSGNHGVQIRTAVCRSEQRATGWNLRPPRVCPPADPALRCHPAQPHHGTLHPLICAACTAFGHFASIGRAGITLAQ